MMTVQIILNELGFDVQKLSRAKIKYIELLVDLYNNNALQKSIYMTKKEVLIENVKGFLLGYSPVIKGLYYED